MTDALTDYAGTVHIPTDNARILSLVPSLTELLFDLDLSANIVGRTHYCIHPADRIDAIPSVGGTKKIVMDRVRDLAPTHVLVNVDENPRQMADDLAELGITVVVTHPQHPDDNLGLYRLIGGLFGRVAAAEELARAYQETRSRMAAPSSLPPRRALYLIWKDPWMAISADTYIANMLSLVNWHAVTPGADPKLAGDAARYPEVLIDETTLSTVDLVLFSSEPYRFADADIRDFQDMYPAHAAKAHLIDGEMTSWYGSRAVHGLGYLKDFSSALPPHPHVEERDNGQHQKRSSPPITGKRTGEEDRN